MKAIVTGCCGFIGSALMRRLRADGWTVLGLDLRAPMSEDSGLLRFDLESGTYFPREYYDVVFHLAATPGVMTSVRHPGLVYANNLASTVHALETARLARASRFVFASSSTVYGNAAADRSDGVDETSELDPLNAYAASKIACENAVRDISAFAGLDYVILRLFSVYGPGMRDDLAMSKALKCARDGSSFYVRGDGSSTRDYTFIDDVVEAFVRAATGQYVLGTYNICGGRPIALRDMLAAVEEASGRKIARERVDASGADAVATHGRNDRARICLGWQPTVSFEEGVRRFVRET